MRLTVNSRENGLSGAHYWQALTLSRLEYSSEFIQCGDSHYYSNYDLEGSFSKGYY